MTTTAATTMTTTAAEVATTVPDMSAVLALFERARGEQAAEVAALRDEVRGLRAENSQLRREVRGSWSTLRQSLADSHACDRRPRAHELQPLLTSHSSIADRVLASKVGK